MGSNAHEQVYTCTWNKPLWKMTQCFPWAQEEEAVVADCWGGTDHRLSRFPRRSHEVSRPCQLTRGHRVEHTSILFFCLADILNKLPCMEECTWDCKRIHPDQWTAASCTLEIRHHLSLVTFPQWWSGLNSLGGSYQEASASPQTPTDVT